MEQISTALWWLLKAGGPPAVILGLIGFLFREKWKQILSKSLQHDLERYKHELSLEQQRHAASLAPQLEEVRHGFQKDLESYKTSLIAQVEKAKLANDVKKTIANRYVEIRFDRFMRLESALAKAGTQIGYMATAPAQGRSPEDGGNAIKLYTALTEAVAECEMFLSIAERQSLMAVTSDMIKLMSNIGANGEPLDINGQTINDFISKRLIAEKMTRAKIHDLADLA